MRPRGGGRVRENVRESVREGEERERESVTIREYERERGTESERAGQR